MTTLQILAGFWNEVLREPVTFLLTTILGTYATIIAHKLSRKFSLQNEDELRTVLHRSTDNAVNYAATEIGTTVTQAIESGMLNEMVEKAKDYVQNRNPDALKELNVTDAALEDIIKAKIGKNVESTVTK